MKQYNFKITPELEEKVKKALEDSGLSGKSEFLEDMVTVYSSHLVNRNETDIDMSAYKHINSKTKKVLHKTFLHLISTMDYNFSSLLQEKLFIEEEKQKLAKKSIEVDNQVNKIKIESIEEKKKLELEHKEQIDTITAENKGLKERLTKEEGLLAKIKEELLSLSVIAKQTTSVIEENKELRAKVSLMEKEHKEETTQLNKTHSKEKQILEERYTVETKRLKANIDELEKSLTAKDKKLFEVSHTLERCREDLKSLNKKRESDLESFKKQKIESQKRLDSATKELTEISSLYNQLIGKIEVFEKFNRENS